MRIKTRPFNLLLALGIVLVIFCLFRLNSPATIDIHVHDTYYVVSSLLILWILPFLALFIFLLYILTNRILYSRKLTWAHVLISFFTLLLLSWALFSGQNVFDTGPRRYIDYSNWTTFNRFQDSSKAIAIITFVLVMAQLIYLTNLIAGIFHLQTKSKRKV